MRSAAVVHNSFLPEFRNPVGSVEVQKDLQLRLTTCFDEAIEVNALLVNRVYENSAKQRMENTSIHWDKSLGSLDVWETTVHLPRLPTEVDYVFQIKTRNYGVVYYVDSGLKGGVGSVALNLEEFQRWFHISVFQIHEPIPEWAQGAFVYQIYPDTFRRAAALPKLMDQASRKFLKWTDPPNGNVPPGQMAEMADNFYYGGDLKGIRSKSSYIQALGADVIYFNPVFAANSSSRYDVTDFFKIDPVLGTNQEFSDLVKMFGRQKMRVILDAPFAASSDKNPLFQDACGSSESLHASWYQISGEKTRGPNMDPRVCTGQDQNHYRAYSGFFEFGNLPLFETNNPQVQNYFFGPGDSVVRHWMKTGIAGWRLDAITFIDNGFDPHKNYFVGLRDAVKGLNRDSFLVGEQWDDAGPWTLGQKWDASLNYIFRGAVLDWLFDSCQGKGCKENIFTENSSDWTIHSISETEFDELLQGNRESYRPEVQLSLWNILGSHDRPRTLWTLKKISGDDEQIAEQKLTMALTFQMTYPGSALIYAGDEVGIKTPSEWIEGKGWISYPYARASFPWPDEHQKQNTRLLNLVQKLSYFKKLHPELKRGDYKTVISDNSHRIFGFTRSGADSKTRCLVIMNRGLKAISHLVVSLSNFPIGSTALLKDSLGHGHFSQINGNVVIEDLDPLTAAIIFLPAK